MLNRYSCNPIRYICLISKKMAYYRVHIILNEEDKYLHLAFVLKKFDKHINNDISQVMKNVDIIHP